jgi:FkbM family methyltransferase
MSYTQRDEEKYILEACARIEPGRFLDVGAWNAFDKSNTRALFESGWGGVCIEPSPGPLRGLVQEYGDSGRVKVVSAAVGVESGWYPLQVTDDALSGNQSATWHEKDAEGKPRGGFYGWLTVRVMTVAEITAQFGGFDMVSIDTEGTSVDIFRALLETEMYPACVVVEHDNRIVEATQAAERKKTSYLRKER